MLLRKLVELEEQGVAGLFGEPAFDVNDLLRTDPSGAGMVTLLELADVADRPPGLGPDLAGRGRGGGDRPVARRRPHPGAWTRLYPPSSRMAPADPATLERVVAGSAIHARYAQPVDPDSAYERLTARLQQAEVPAPAPEQEPEREREPARERPAGPRPPRPASTPMT